MTTFSPPAGTMLINLIETDWMHCLPFFYSLPKNPVLGKICNDTSRTLNEKFRVFSPFGLGKLIGVGVDIMLVDKAV